MSFAKCWKCQEELNPPSPQEDMLDGWYCSKRHQQPRKFTIEQWICIIWNNHIELEERINELTGGR